MNFKCAFALVKEGVKVCQDASKSRFDNYFQFGPEKSALECPFQCGGGGAKAKRAMPKCLRREFQWCFPYKRDWVEDDLSLGGSGLILSGARCGHLPWRPQSLKGRAGAAAASILGPAAPICQNEKVLPLPETPCSCVCHPCPSLGHIQTICQTTPLTFIFPYKGPPSSQTSHTVLKKRNIARIANAVKNCQTLLNFQKKSKLSKLSKTVNIF